MDCGGRFPPGVMSRDHQRLEKGNLGLDEGGCRRLDLRRWRRSGRRR